MTYELLQKRANTPGVMRRGFNFAKNEVLSPSGLPAYTGKRVWSRMKNVFGDIGHDVKRGVHNVKTPTKDLSKYNRAQKRADKLRDIRKSRELQQHKNVVRDGDSFAAKAVLKRMADAKVEPGKVKRVVNGVAKATGAGVGGAAVGTTAHTLGTSALNAASPEDPNNPRNPWLKPLPWADKTMFPVLTGANAFTSMLNSTGITGDSKERARHAAEVGGSMLSDPSTRNLSSGKPRMDAMTNIPQNTTSPGFLTGVLGQGHDKVHSPTGAWMKSKGAAIKNVFTGDGPSADRVGSVFNGDADNAARGAVYENAAIRKYDELHKEGGANSGFTRKLVTKYIPETYQDFKGGVKSFRKSLPARYVGRVAHEATAGAAKKVIPELHARELLRAKLTNKLNTTSEGIGKAKAKVKDVSHKTIFNAYNPKGNTQRVLKSIPTVAKSIGKPLATVGFPAAIGTGLYHNAFEPTPNGELYEANTAYNVLGRDTRSKMDAANAKVPEAERFPVTEQNVASVDGAYHADTPLGADWRKAVSDTRAKTIQQRQQQQQQPPAAGIPPVMAQTPGVIKSSAFGVTFPKGTGLATDSFVDKVNDYETSPATDKFVRKIIPQTVQDKLSKLNMATKIDPTLPREAINDALPKWMRPPVHAVYKKVTGNVFAGKGASPGPLSRFKYHGGISGVLDVPADHRRKFTVGSDGQHQYYKYDKQGKKVYS